MQDAPNAAEPLLIRARQLLAQGRHDEAADWSARALRENPHLAEAHQQLAFAKMGQGRHAEAMAAAAEALRLEPGNPFYHWTVGLAHLSGGRPKEALQGAQTAWEMAPYVPAFCHLRAVAHLALDKPADALIWADHGLALDPTDSACLHARSQALIRLRRTGEAHDSARDALAADPDDASSHANAGWTALHRNEIKQALVHFKESLRLDPGNAWAKEGLVEALKAKNPVYRVLLAYFLWSARLPPGMQTAIMIGGYLGYRFLYAGLAANPATQPLATGLMAAYLLFALSTWIAVPLGDLFLWLTPYGRHALSPDRRRVSLALGGMLLVVAGMGIWWAAGHDGAKLLCLVGLFLTAVTIGVLRQNGAPRYNWGLAAIAGLWACWSYLLVAMGLNLELPFLAPVFETALYGGIAAQFAVAFGFLGRSR